MKEQGAIPCIFGIDVDLSGEDCGANDIVGPS